MAHLNTKPADTEGSSFNFLREKATEVKGPHQDFPFFYILLLHATKAEMKLWNINTKPDP